MLPPVRSIPLRHSGAVGLTSRYLCAARSLRRTRNPGSGLPSLCHRSAGTTLLRGSPAVSHSHLVAFSTAPACLPTDLVRNSPQAIAHRVSLADPNTFWRDAAREIDWFTEPRTVSQWDESSGTYQWFRDGTLNMAYNCLDRHVIAGHGDRAAIIYDSPVTRPNDPARIITYAELLDEVILFARVLRRQGVKKGHRVLIYMPMIPETLVAMLACARIGAIHSVVFGGFAPAELAKRIVACMPRVTVSASCGVERPGNPIAYKPLLDEALTISAQSKALPSRNIVFQRPECPAALQAQQGDLSWHEQMALAREEQQRSVDPAEDDCAVQCSTDPLYILYTSGTTGTPKGVARDTGGHAVSLMWDIRHFLNVGPGEVLFSSSDPGWVVGHSHTCYAPLLGGCTTVLYEGKPVGTPDAGAFWRVIAQHQVKAFFTAPTALMVLRREDPHGELMRRYDLRSLCAMFVAGERCQPEILVHFQRLLPPGVPVVDNWWQTETGAPITGIAQGPCPVPPEIVLYEPRLTSPPPVRPGSAGIPVPGYKLIVARVPEGEEEESAVAEETYEYPLTKRYKPKVKPISPMDPAAPPAIITECLPGEQGQVLLKLPLPPGTFYGLWSNRPGYLDAYFNRFPGYYDTGDVGLVDTDGYVHILSRADDILNVAAHRLSTGVFEETLVSHRLVAEACVVPCPHAIKGNVPLGFLVLKHDATAAEAAAEPAPFDTAAAVIYQTHPSPAIQQLRAQIVQSVRSNVGAFASLQSSHLVILPRLPKTRSGKVLRKYLRTMVRFAVESTDANPDVPCPLPLPATIEDAAVASEVWPIVVAFARYHVVKTDTA
ncbi:hypothetical protein IWQ60_003390 [Tieghemiomyces parasiticus]|uniref:Propionate--CoA ligase n=1 Tax=Tieghemiomyces parasiticus TaxID=78921 RepID=A0A9W8A9N9_9FUNG|nr:hypothetical protein IWQ60_003390 [Tieghemiomyces parasiticus]